MSAPGLAGETSPQAQVAQSAVRAEAGCDAGVALDGAKSRSAWVFNHYAQEPGGTIGRVSHYSMARHLGKFGWQLTVIAASVEHNTGRQRLERGEGWRTETIDGVPFVWLRTPTYSGNGFRRIANMLAYASSALTVPRRVGLTRPDVIVGTTVHPFAAWAAATVARRLRVPYLFEVRDLWPQTLIDMGQMSERSLSARALRALERWLCQRAVRVLTVLPQAEDYLVGLGVQREAVVWLPNGVDLAEFPEVPYPCNDAFTLMYFGAHGRANGLDTLLDAVALLRRRPLARPLRLRLVGDGPLKATLMNRASALGLENVSFEPPVPRALIPVLAGAADAFVFSLLDVPVFRFGISSNKLFDYLAAGRPIVFACAASNNPVAEAGAGLTVPASDPPALADAIARLIAMPERARIEMGRAGRRYVQVNHDYARLAERLARTFNAVTRGHETDVPSRRSTVSAG